MYQLSVSNCAQLFKCSKIECCEFYVFNNNIQIQRFAVGTLVNIVKQLPNPHTIENNSDTYVQWLSTLPSRLLSSIAILLKMNFVEESPETIDVDWLKCLLHFSVKLLLIEPNSEHAITTCSNLISLLPHVKGNIIIK